MKTYCRIIVMLTIIASCAKPNIDNHNTNSETDYTPAPHTTPINTAISAYIETNDQKTNPVDLKINDDLTFWDFGSYSTNTISSVDMYNSNIIVHNQKNTLDFFNNYRNFPVTSSLRNYVDVNNIPKNYIGYVTYANYGGQWLLPGGGKITYAPFSFGNYYGPGNQIGAYYYFLDPTKRTFSITNPSFTIDVDSKRWYLKSLGIIAISTPYPIAAGSNVQLEYPIPVDLLTSAPDSIPAWTYDNYKWIAKGYAKKVAGTYTVRIDAEGLWNFAIPVKGLYKKFKVRTDAGVPVTNSILRIKNATGEVGSARTDADGNAICFLPVNEEFTIEIPFSWNDISFPPPAFSLPLPAFSSSEDVSINLPSTSGAIVTILGDAAICGGGPIQNGTVTITNRSGLVHCYISVINGKYHSALVRPHDNEIYVVKVLNNATSESGSDTAVALRTGIDNIINVSTCKDPTNLFINYSIDGIGYSITGDAKNPQNPPLVAYNTSVSTVGTLISCSDGQTSNGNGLQFLTNITYTGNSNSVASLYVNSIYYANYDFTKIPKVIFTRYDLLAGGYIEGSLDVYYKDNQGVSHHLVADFRLKRIT